MNSIATIMKGAILCTCFVLGGIAANKHHDVELNETIPIESNISKETSVMTSLVSHQPDKQEEPVFFDIPLSHDLQGYIFSYCKENDMDPRIVISIIKKESKYDASVIGDDGNSFGLMQVQSQWHQERMNNLGCDDLLDSYQNVTVGMDYLKDLYSTGEPIEWVLMAYNGGPSYAYDNMSNNIVSDYSKEILAYCDVLDMLKKKFEGVKYE